MRAGEASRYWGHQINNGGFEFRLFSRKPILEAGAGYERIHPRSVTVSNDPKNKPDVLADLAHLPFESGSFGLCVAHEVLCVHTQEKQEEIVRELARVADSLYLRQWKGCGWRLLGNPKCGFKFPGIYKGPDAA